MKTKLVFILLILLGFVSLFVGTNELSFTHFIKFLFYQIEFTNEQIYILQNLRLPRTMVAISVGASLALAGQLLQTSLENPLAEPYTLGLSGGATLGALTALLIGIDPLGITLAIGGILGCFLVMVLLLSFAKTVVFQSRSVILFGLMISLFCGSFVVLILSLFDPNKLHTAMHWMMGQCGTDRDIWWPYSFLVLIATYCWVLLRSRGLDSMLLGENLAINTGQSTHVTRREIIVAVSLLTAFSVALMGLIGFVGLLAPHISEKIHNSRRIKKTLFSTCASGALLILSGDILGRLLGGDQEIPAGSLVALLGAPCLIYLLLQERQVNK